MTKLQTQEIYLREKFDLLVGGTPCFTKGHQVLTATGYENIEDVVAGDYVVTHKGRLQKVLRTGFKQAEVGTLSAVGLPSKIVCTPNHPFRSVEYRNQNTHLNGESIRKEIIGEPSWTDASELVGKQWCSLITYDIKGSPTQSAKFDAKTCMYLAGMYLGDGWVRKFKGKKAVVFGFNAAKLELFKKAVGNVKYTVAYEPTAIKVTVYDTMFADWLLDNFSGGAVHKTLPAWVLSHEHKSELLRGYLDTDGGKIQNGHAYSSVSKSLAYGICDLMNAEGYVTSVNFIKTPDTCVIEGRTVNQRDYYQGKGYFQPKSRKSRLHHNLLLRTVQSYELQATETVYNIEVEGDNSYIINGAIVHNCQDDSIAGLRKGMDGKRGVIKDDFVRILGDKQPDWFVWENVPGVLSSNGGKNFSTFLGNLKAVGYSFCWRIIDAQYCGVPQRRRRVFIVGYLGDDWRPSAAVLFEPQSMPGYFKPIKKEREDTSRITGGSVKATSEGGLKDVTMSITASYGTGGADLASKPLLYLSTPRGSHGEITGTECARDYKGVGNQYVEEGKLIVHGTQDPCVSDKAFALGRNNGGENVLFDRQSSSQYGTAEVTSTVSARDYKSATDLVVGCLDTEFGYQKQTFQSVSAGQGHALRSRVRRLTEVEGERLQGMPAHHTNIIWKGKPAPSGQRYKAIGNSMATVAMHWIGKRIDFVNGVLNDLHS